MEKKREDKITEYEELRAAGLSDEQIKMLRNSGATHEAILLYARERRAELAKQNARGISI
jgi:hypothetical protein